MIRHIIVLLPAVIFGMEVRVQQVKDGTKTHSMSFPIHITTGGLISWSLSLRQDSSHL